MTDSERLTLLQAGARVGETVVRALGPQLLAVVLLNMLFAGLLLWYLDARATHTVMLVDKLLTECLRRPG